jgi:hypothetical protein
MELVEKELQPGEQVNWLDMPVPLFFTSESLTAFIVGIVFTAFPILFARGYARQEAIAFGLPLALVSPLWIFGLVFLCSPIWLYRKWCKTIYAITDKRAITIKAGWSSTVQSFSPDMLHNIHVKEKRYGIGDVIISGQNSRERANGKKAKKLGFLQVRKPQEVKKKLTKLAEQIITH